mmetsp:Transcript_2163/g.5751  ORF Transcript_2163/g.5751 Transcript_2163/m.5751 type:complete len:221 (-) Transcript_2163:258-920(-)
MPGCHVERVLAEGHHDLRQTLLLRVLVSRCRRVRRRDDGAGHEFLRELERRVQVLVHVEAADICHGDVDGRAPLECACVPQRIRAGGLAQVGGSGVPFVRIQRGSRQQTEVGRELLAPGDFTLRHHVGVLRGQFADLENLIQRGQELGLDGAVGVRGVRRVGSAACGRRHRRRVLAGVMGCGAQVVVGSVVGKIVAVVAPRFRRGELVGGADHGGQVLDA